MFEYILVFTLGFFIGYGIDDIGNEQAEKTHIKKQKMIFEKIIEDKQRGYVPNFKSYEDIYNKYRK